MELFMDKNLIDFEKSFISYYKSKIVYNETPLNTEDFINSLRVFTWFAKEFEFSDVRTSCEDVITLFGSKDPFNLGLMSFLLSYVNHETLYCNDFALGISNNIPQTIQAFCGSYQKLLLEQDSNANTKPLVELKVAFNRLENVRKYVLLYFGDFFRYHISELPLIQKFHQTDIEDILYEMILNTDEIDETIMIQLRDKLKKMVLDSNLVFSHNSGFQTETIISFINNED
ncbi:MAG: hypothetical protein MRY83_10925 [Flavobacteriales bacterium]|nr:hypothetical protein [Flavobacteriales bacterium]